MCREIWFSLLVHFVHSFIKELKRSKLHTKISSLRENAQRDPSRLRIEYPFSGVLPTNQVFRFRQWRRFRLARTANNSLRCDESRETSLMSLLRSFSQRDVANLRMSNHAILYRDWRKYGRAFCIPNQLTNSSALHNVRIRTRFLKALKSSVLLRVFLFFVFLFYTHTFIRRV